MFLGVTLSLCAGSLAWGYFELVLRGSWLELFCTDVINVVVLLNAPHTDISFKYQTQVLLRTAKPKALSWKTEGQWYISQLSSKLSVCFLEF